MQMEKNIDALLEIRHRHSMLQRALQGMQHRTQPTAAAHISATYARKP
jgi:hypothetical protein